MKRWILFFLTNLLVTMTLLIIANVVMSYMGVSYGSNTGLFIMCFALGMGGAFVSLMLSRWMAIRTMGLQPAANGSAIVQKVHSMARKSGLTQPPEVYIYQSPEINAFATGPSRNKSLVAVSTGLLDSMNEDEVDGVLAHEVSHIANGDMVTMTLVQGIVNTFVMFFSYIVTQIVMNAMRGDDDDRRGGGFGNFFLYHIIHNVVYMALSFLSLPLVMYVSRWREYRADIGSAQLVGKAKMVAALEKLQQNYGQTERHEKSIEVMSISSCGSFAELFSSHPPLEKRISALRTARVP
jgi:heat shock protein HtpX